MVIDTAQVRRAALQLAAPLVRGRIVILTGAAAASRRMATFFADAGATRTASIALRAAHTQTQRRFTGYEAELANPGTGFRRTLDAADPDRAALVYAGSFTAVSDVCGRPTIGARTKAHVAAERKDVQQTLLGFDGRVVAVGTELDMMRPLVIQGIPDKTIAMATSHTYLVPEHGATSRLTALIARLDRDCTTVLLRRFDTGIPCTFYGFITPAWTVDFGPVEALVYWHKRTWRLHAPGILRPLVVDSRTLETARHAVHAAASRLHHRTGYVGAFGADGVLSNDQYVIHEINPRICAGFSLLDNLQPKSAPLAAVDLVLRDCGRVAMEALQSPLSAMAHRISRDPTKRFRLWEPTKLMTEIEHQLKMIDEPREWVHHIRRSTGGRDLVHVTALHASLR